MSYVPPLSRVGDEVCVLFGMEVPFILRPVPGSSSLEYELVGECYVHGMMDGEACPVGSAEREFRIR